MNNLTPNSKIPNTTILIQSPNAPLKIEKSESFQKHLENDFLTKIGHFTPKEFDDAYLKNDNLHPNYDLFLGKTILHFAAEAGNTSLTEHLITNYQADVNGGSQISGTPLFCAIDCENESKRFSIVKTLILKKADVNRGRTLLSYYGGTMSPITNLTDATVLRDAPGIDLKITLFLILHKAVAFPSYNSIEEIDKSIAQDFERKIPEKEKLLQKNLFEAQKIYEKSLCIIQSLTNGSPKLLPELCQKIVSTIIDLYTKNYETLTQQ